MGAIDGDRKKTGLINKIALGGYINADYSQKAGDLYDKYHAIEINPNISMSDKIKEMEEWWITHNQLLVDSGLSLEVIKNVIKNEDPYFREGSFELLDLLKQNKVPLIIMSSSRGTLIKGFLEKYGKMYDNIHIIANFFKFDKKGNAIGYTKPVIHVFNKNETSVKGLPIYGCVTLKGDKLA